MPYSAGNYVNFNTRTINSHGGDNSTPVFFGWRLERGIYIRRVRFHYTANVSTVVAVDIRMALGNNEPAVEADFDALNEQLVNDPGQGWFLYGHCDVDMYVDRHARENTCLVCMVSTTATDAFVTATLEIDTKRRLTRKQIAAI